MVCLPHLINHDKSIRFQNSQRVCGAENIALLSTYFFEIHKALDAVFFFALSWYWYDEQRVNFSERCFSSSVIHSCCKCMLVCSHVRVYVHPVLVTRY